jgi:hypothetical protein
VAILEQMSSDRATALMVHGKVIPVISVISIGVPLLVVPYKKGSLPSVVYLNEVEEAWERVILGWL